MSRKETGKSGMVKTTEIMSLARKERMERSKGKRNPRLDNSTLKSVRQKSLKALEVQIMILTIHTSGGRFLMKI